jgi:predicted dehydrogenase
VHQVADFIEGLDSGKPAMPDFRDALRTTFVCDAVLESAKRGAWVEV